MTAAELGTIIQVGMAMAIPFLFGIATGVEIVRRRPKGVYERFGEVIGDHIIGLHDKVRFLPEGSGTVVRVKFVLPDFQGRPTELEMRVVA